MIACQYCLREGEERALCERCGRRVFTLPEIPASLDADYALAFAVLDGNGSLAWIAIKGWRQGIELVRRHRERGYPLIAAWRVSQILH